MLKKIISGGQTGADQAALDLAIKLNIDHGGWIPKGRLTEAGPLDSRYRLKEMDSKDYRDRTRQNIIDSDGTVIISRGPLTGGSKLTRSYAREIGRPNCFLDLSIHEEFEASVILKSFLSENSIKTLNVAGPRLSGQPWIYQDVRTVLEAALYLLFLDSDHEKKIAPFVSKGPFTAGHPDTLDDAVNLIIGEMTLRTRSFIAGFDPDRIFMLYFSFQDYIKIRAGLDRENKELMVDCGSQMGSGKPFTEEDAVMLILREVKKRLEPDHILRVVK